MWDKRCAKSWEFGEREDALVWPMQCKPGGHTQGVARKDGHGSNPAKPLTGHTGHCVDHSSCTATCTTLASSPLDHAFPGLWSGLSKLMSRGQHPVRAYSWSELPVGTVLQTLPRSKLCPISPLQNVYEDKWTKTDLPLRSKVLRYVWKK